MGWMTEVRFPAGVRTFSLRHRVQTGSGLLSNEYRSFCPRVVKQPGREADHSPLCSSMVRDKWSYTSTTLHFIMACTSRLKVTRCLNVVCIMPFGVKVLCASQVPIVVCIQFCTLITNYTRFVSKVRGLTLLRRVGTLWGCGDSLFFEVPPLASDALITTLHPLFENVLQTVDHFQKRRNLTGRDLN
jgi:hypothetical protein